MIKRGIKVAESEKREMNRKTLKNEKMEKEGKTGKNTEWQNKDTEDKKKWE